eukprot:2604880-Pyramimonas_sp.AAC.1
MLYSYAAKYPGAGLLKLRTTHRPAGHSALSNGTPISRRHNRDADDTVLHAKDEATTYTAWSNYSAAKRNNTTLEVPTKTTAAT